MHLIVIPFPVAIPVQDLQPLIPVVVLQDPKPVLIQHIQEGDHVTRYHFPNLAPTLMIIVLQDIPVHPEAVFCLLLLI